MNIQDAIQFTLDYAKEKGAEADVVAHHSRSLDISSEKAEVSEFSVNSSSLLGVRVSQSKKIGVSYSESLEKESLKHMVDSALNTSRISDEDPHQQIRQTPEEKIDGTNDRIYREDSTEIEEKVATAIRLETGLLEKDNVVKNSPYNGFTEAETHQYYGNTHGSFCQQNSRSYSCFSSALLEENDQQAMHFKKCIGRQFVDLNLDACLEDIYKNAKQILHADTIKTGKYDVTFTQDCLASIFSFYESLFSGKGAVLGTNPWRDSLEKKVANSELTMTDVPTDEEAFPYVAFDDEGFRTSPTTLMQNGVLKTFYHNSSTASELGAQNTHSAERSPKGHLGVSGTNLRINPGRTNETSVHKGDYIEIFQIQGLGSGANAISGDFSVGVSGYLKRDGETVKPFRGVTLSGNFFEMLNNVTLGENISSNTVKSFFSPTMRFHDLSVGGH